MATLAFATIATVRRMRTFKTIGALWLAACAVVPVYASTVRAQPADTQVQLIARDVDGDQDLDLVVVSAVEHRPVGVWVNDGHGHFSAGRPADFPASIWQVSDGPALTGPSSVAGESLAGSETARTDAPDLPTSCVHDVAPSASEPPGAFPVPHRRFDLSGTSSRAPPA